MYYHLLSFTITCRHLLSFTMTMIAILVLLYLCITIDITTISTTSNYHLLTVILDSRYGLITDNYNTSQ